MTEPQTCHGPECDKPAQRGGFCWAHLKRKQRSRPLSGKVRGYGMSKREKRSRAALRYANAETQEEFDRAADLLKKY